MMSKREKKTLRRTQNVYMRCETRIVSAYKVCSKIYLRDEMSHGDFTNTITFVPLNTTTLNLIFFFTFFTNKNLQNFHFNLFAKSNTM